MPGLQEQTIGGSPPGTLKWVTVKGRDETGRVVGHAEALENGVYVMSVLFKSTGEVCRYQQSSLTPCDAPA